VSRHTPNDGEIAIAKLLGYEGLIQKNVNFSTTPIRDLFNAGIVWKKIAIVAPTYITNILLNRNFELIEFVNSPMKREKGKFACNGAYIYKLKHMRTSSFIKQIYIPCPISLKEQTEMSLTPEKRIQ